MAKLYFRYGTMGSAKTLNLLAVLHNYEQQGKKALLLKPLLDTRFGHDVVQSRAGLSHKADLLLQGEETIQLQAFLPLQCILVDEAQFLQPSIIQQLRDIATYDNIPVICYGLRTDFRGKLFPGSQSLFELADSFEEVKTTCAYCNKKATMNLRFIEGKATLSGETVLLGADENYQPACYPCYRQKLFAAQKTSTL